MGGKCPALSQSWIFRGKLAGLELTVRKNLLGSPAVIRPSGRSHLFKGRIIPARGNKVNFVSKAN